MTRQKIDTSFTKMVIFRENSENWTTKCWNYSFQFHFSTNTCCACYYEVMIVFIFFRNTAKYRISQKLTDSYCCVRNRYLYATVYVEKAENRHIFYKNGNILSKLIKLNYKMLKLFFPVSFLHEHILCVLLWTDEVMLIVLIVIRNTALSKSYSPFITWIVSEKGNFN